MDHGVVLDSAKLDFFVEIVNHSPVIHGFEDCENWLWIVSCLS